MDSDQKFSVKQKKHVIFLLLPQVQLLDLGGPAQVFYTAARLGAPYKLSFCASQEHVNSAQGLMLGGLQPPGALPPANLLLIPGISSENELLSRPLLDDDIYRWLQQINAAGTPIASVCTGAFALGEAGILDGRRCTTHWFDIDLLKERYPTAQVLDNVLFVVDGQVTTSAGIASGIDMALWLVEQDMGPLFAAQVARYLVVYVRRNGSQPQHSIYLDYRTHLNTGVHHAQNFIITHVTERISLEEIGQAARLATRSLSRAFKEATGLTPIQYQQYLRLALAQSLLANPRLNVGEVAEKCGFEDVRHFRRLWKAHYGTSPSAERHL